MYPEGDATLPALKGVLHTCEAVGPAGWGGRAAVVNVRLGMPGPQVVGVVGEGVVLICGEG